MIPLPRTTQRRRSPRWAIAVGVVGLSALAAACGTPASSAEATVPVSEWVAEFDRLCVETSAELTADLSDKEFAAISRRALNEMRELPAPDEMANEADELLEAIETTTTDLNLDDATIEALDNQALDAMTALGVSDACIGGPAG